jgi:hypothetical protein
MVWIIPLIVALGCCFWWLKRSKSALERKLVFYWHTLAGTPDLAKRLLADMYGYWTNWL